MSSMRDKRVERRLSILAQRLAKEGDAVARARLAAEIRDLSETIVASSIRDANGEGRTWRQLAEDLDVPFQTLYRRYGANV
jgi:hypothetical protein